MIVVGSGPNGLAAAIVMAQAGFTVAVLEGSDTAGGGLRSASLTQDGFVHDVCSGVHPMAIASPFFRQLPLTSFGLEWVHPIVPVAHPLNTESVLLYEDIQATANQFGRDAKNYLRLFQPIAEHAEQLLEDILQPLLRMPQAPRHLLPFALHAALPASVLARSTFRTSEARALFAGIAAHAALPFTSMGSSSIGLVLTAIGHQYGWPFPKGGAQSLADALLGYLKSLGGSVFTSVQIRDLKDLPDARIKFLDVSTNQFLSWTEHLLPWAYRTLLHRYSYGAGVFKIDYALRQPLPWRDPRTMLAGTVHLGGTLEEIERAEWEVNQGRHPERPYVLLAQHTSFDTSRAPSGKHTLWAYCRVPAHSDVDMTERIEAQIERYAPGFKECILQRASRHAVGFAAYNPNLIGGDITGGRNTLLQMISRPVPTSTPYRTPLKGIYLCSASTPPGGGVHGMCGVHAARAALHDLSYRY
ncbi:phytoene dehydrogenase-like protein [Deinococcus enclensis]|uniref:Phytoene dehydrogenase-like protein n=1 Tax=Deinococcus enclensis TaxID=1049582 RepID=A0ABT9MIW8_9DEIO|nr:phytoene dehydrogenase-like protein [Deinococcus enclensis]